MFSKVWNLTTGLFILPKLYIVHTWILVRFLRLSGSEGLVRIPPRSWFPSKMTSSMIVVGDLRCGVWEQGNQIRLWKEKKIKFCRINCRFFSFSTSFETKLNMWQLIGFKKVDWVLKKVQRSKLTRRKIKWNKTTFKITAVLRKKKNHVGIFYDCPFDSKIFTCDLFSSTISTVLWPGILFFFFYIHYMNSRWTSKTG